MHAFFDSAGDRKFDVVREFSIELTGRQRCGAHEMSKEELGTKEALHNLSRSDRSSDIIELTPPDYPEIRR